MKKKVNSHLDSFKGSTLKEINILCYSYIWFLVHWDNVSSKFYTAVYTRLYV